MEPSTVQHARPPEDPGAPPSAGLPEDAPPAIRAAADGDTSDVTVGGEKDGIYWLLQPARAMHWECRVDYDTPEGIRPLRWGIRSLDGKRIDDIEQRNSTGEGPFAKVNQLTTNAELVAEASTIVRDSGSGRKIDLHSEEFRTTPAGDVLASTAEALRLRMHFQSGLLAYLAEEVRRISGWSPDRVGQAQRVLVDAAGNS